MSFYCPECGSEVTDGIKCTDCGHVDEDCSECDIPLDTNAWFCSDCDAPRDNCIECGSILDENTCPNCDTVRPNLCDSCGGLIERGSMECDSCGHELGGKFRSRAKKANYAGYILAGVLTLPILPGLYQVVTQGISPIFVANMLVFPILVLLLAKILSVRWNKKAKKQIN